MGSWSVRRRTLGRCSSNEVRRRYSIGAGALSESVDDAVLKPIFARSRTWIAYFVGRVQHLQTDSVSCADYEDTLSSTLKAIFRGDYAEQSDENSFLVSVTSIFMRAIGQRPMYIRIRRREGGIVYGEALWGYLSDESLSGAHSAELVPLLLVRGGELVQSAVVQWVQSRFDTFVQRVHFERDELEVMAWAWAQLDDNAAKQCSLAWLLPQPVRSHLTSVHYQVPSALLHRLWAHFNAPTSKNPADVLYGNVQRAMNALHGDVRRYFGVDPALCELHAVAMTHVCAAANGAVRLMPGNVLNVLRFLTRQCLERVARYHRPVTFD